MVAETYDNSTTLVLVPENLSWYRVVVSSHASHSRRDHRPLSDHRAHRRRWHGRSLQSLRQQAPTRRRVKGPARGIRLATGPPPPLLPGSTRRFGAHASTHTNCL